ncbi:hypothetical protein Rs2_37518 [Raphanus sativus]|nr:hypothetical protein Rs2_37518 [Raphanus sativus]
MPPLFGQKAKTKRKTGSFSPPTSPQPYLYSKYKIAIDAWFRAQARRRTEETRRKQRPSGSGGHRWGSDDGTCAHAPSARGTQDTDLLYLSSFEQTSLLLISDLYL